MAYAASTGDHGCPRENGPGFGLPVETRQNARSIVGMPACDTHPGDGAPGGIVKACPRPGVAPGNGASCPSRAPQGSSAHPLNTRPWVVIRESRHDHPRQVPLMAEATITCVTCRTHKTPAVLTGMPGSRPRCPRRSTNGPWMKARGLRLEDGIWLAGSRARTCPDQHTSCQAGLSRPGLRGSRGEHGEINNWPHHRAFLASGG
jgi:hypothetical protein